MQEIKEDFIHQFNASGGIDSIKEYGLEILIQELKALEMSEEEIDRNLSIIKDKLNIVVADVVALATDKIHSCKMCHNKNIVGTCIKCKKVYYCSKQCQVDHWQIHKKVCKKA
jgi:hypothetical protein